jgi:hypothetical protein
MWYAIAIAVASLGMYFILAHKDRELSGRQPHPVVSTSRDVVDRFVAGLSHKIGHAVGVATKSSTQAAKKICVGGGKICMQCCTVAYDRGVTGVRAIARVARTASKKIAHPSSRDDSATLAQR